MLAIDVPAWSPKSSSPWHAFLKVKRREGFDMKQSGALWNALGEEDKKVFRQLASEQAGQGQGLVDLRRPMPHERTPLGIGDYDKPVREDVAAVLCEGNEVYRRAAAWRNEVRKVPPKHRCCNTLKRGTEERHGGRTSSQEQKTGPMPAGGVSGRPSSCSPMWRGVWCLQMRDDVHGRGEDSVCGDA